MSKFVVSRSSPQFKLNSLRQSLRELVARLEREAAESPGSYTSEHLTRIADELKAMLEGTP